MGEEKDSKQGKKKFNGARLSGKRSEGGGGKNV